MGPKKIKGGFIADGLRFLENRENSGGEQGMDTGFNNLNGIIHGLPLKRWLFVAAVRNGKRFAVNAIRQCSITLHHRPGCDVLDGDGRHSLAERMISSIGGISIEICGRRHRDNDWPKLAAAVQQMRRMASGPSTKRRR